MTRIADHLQDKTIINPFPGLRFLESAIGRTITARIGSNESIALDSQALLAQFGEAFCQLARYYPDPSAAELRARVAGVCGVEDNAVLFDAGADSLILLALRVVCNVGDIVITSAGTYPTFRYFAEGVGVNIVEVAYDDSDGQLRPDLDALAEAAEQHQAALVYLANPDNPSGYYHDGAAIHRFRERLPADTVLLLDEAYSDFCGDDLPSGLLPNTVRLRTFSKAYGLAGLRVGYALADPDLIAKAAQVRIHYAVSSIAQAAATLVFDEPGYRQQIIDQTVAMRTTLGERLRAAGLEVLPSATNFVTVRYQDADSAKAIQQQLWQRQAAVHRPPHPALGHLLRITVHPQALDDEVIGLLAQA